MSKKSSSSSSTGISFTGLMTIVFITLKLTGHINWHWALVLGPLWMPFALLVIAALLYVLVSELIDAIKSK